MTCIDLHCDLLAYLELFSTRSPYDLAARCSFPQLKQGEVKLQVMAIFTQTVKGSTLSAWRQFNHYQALCSRYQDDVCHYQPSLSLKESKQTQLVLAIENGSGLWEENEPFAQGVQRLQRLVTLGFKPLYLGMTWHQENRFGGGNASKIGLKEEGKELLKIMDELQIAIDLSHTSDALAHDILDYLEQKSFSLPVLASHSNARSVCPQARNLPDPLAKEIFKRQGVIGLNLYRKFIGERIEALVDHIAHWLELGGEKSIALGADFFYEKDFDLSNNSYFSQFEQASCYPQLLSFIQRALLMKKEEVDAFAYQNAATFIKKVMV